MTEQLRVLIHKIQDAMISNVKTINTGEINRVLADPVRINIMEGIRRADLSLGELAEFLHMDERLLLYHLRILIRSGAITEERRGYRTIYVITDSLVADSSRVLYEMWAREARRPHSHFELSL